MAEKSRNLPQKIIKLVDEVQQDNKWLAVPYAVIKKYGDDETGYQGALITYYGFLSLFPLLIVATSVIHIIGRGNQQLQDKLFAGINNYFPSIGGDLQTSVHGSNKTGVALIIGLLITFYGAKGVADAIRHALNHVWEVPKQERAGFPKGLLKSLGLMVGGGLGFLIAAVLSSFATARFGHSFYFRLLPIILSYLMLLAVFTFVFRIGSSAKHGWRELLPGAALAALGNQVLQTVGGYLITHQLQHLTGVYGRFGLVLAILFWIYLQAQVFLYAAEYNSVHTLRLYPRSITSDPLTNADKRAFKLYAQRETVMAPPEKVHVEFEDESA